MWIFFAAFGIITTLSRSESTELGLERINSDVSSVEYAENHTAMKEDLYLDEKRNAMKYRQRMRSYIKPLLSRDIKCLTFSDKYCSTEMKQIKSVLIQALQENCVQCSNPQKEQAGKVMSALMIHHPDAWKVFFSNYGSRTKKNGKSYE